MIGGVDRLDDAAFVADADRHADELDGDLGLDGLVERDLDEVEVGDLAAHRMALELTGDGKVLVLADFEVDEGVQARSVVRAAYNSRWSTATVMASMPRP